MDFIKKKVFETQIRNVSRDLGFVQNSNSAFSSQPDNSDRIQKAWHNFTGRSPTQEDTASADLEAAEVDGFPSIVESAFNSRPKNFPPCVSLFYIDGSILSKEAAMAVKCSFYTLCFTIVNVVFNVSANVTVVAVMNGKDWYNILLSIIAGCVLFSFQLLTYESGFRGAYRNSTNLRMRYIWMSVGNGIIFSVYCFTNLLFFNGFSTLSNLAKNEAHFRLRNTLAAIESTAWTFLLILNIYSLYEYYNVLGNRQQGLSDQAYNDALAQNSQSTSSRPHQNRIQEIRDRYAICTERTCA